MLKKISLMLVIILVCVFAPVAQAKSIVVSDSGIFHSSIGTILEEEKHIGDEFCTQKEVITALKALGIILIIVRILIPSVIVSYATKEYVNTVVAGTPDSLKKESLNLGYRVVLGLLVFFFPTIINAFLNGLNAYNVISKDVNQCQNCLFRPMSEGACYDGTNHNAERDVDAEDMPTGRNNGVDASTIPTGRNDGVDANTIPTGRNDGVDANTIPTGRNDGVDANTIPTVRNDGVDANTIPSNRNNDVGTTQPVVIR